MKTLLILILFTFSLSSYGQRDNLQLPECEILVKNAAQQYGCLMAYYAKKNTLMKAADCFRDNEKIDKGIQVIEANIFDVHENTIGDEGWIAKLVEFQKYKYGEEYVKKEINNVQPIVEIDKEMLELSLGVNGLSDSLKIEAADFLYTHFYISVEVFGKKYHVYSNQNEKENTNNICKAFLLGKITEEELNIYFTKHWKETKMYQEFMK